MAMEMITKAMMSFIIFLLVSSTTTGVGIGAAELSVGFYADTCPTAESIVHDSVEAAVMREASSSAFLLRMHFHDCFVEGCDASIMVEKGPRSENRAARHLGVRGFDIIEGAKAELERVCPGVVSCADIIALAARDAIVMSNGPFYDVPTGRRDGRVSNKALAANMPDVDDSIEVLRAKFHQKGLSDQDLVLLSAAHTIGRGACFFMTNRLYKFTAEGGSDPSIRADFIPFLKGTCPLGGNLNVRMPLDRITEFEFDTQILHNINNGFAVLSSDARLLDNNFTRSLVDDCINNKRPFFSDFISSIIKMGQIEIKTGFDGEIRKLCQSNNRKMFPNSLLITMLFVFTFICFL